MENGIVDRVKETVEDDTLPTVDRVKETVEDNPSPTVNREKATVEDNADVSKWTVIFFIQEVLPDSVLKHVPKDSQHYQWNKPVIFGRGEDVDIFLNDDKASRHHLELTGQLLPNAQVCFSVRNVSSTKSVLVNGQQIHKDCMSYVESGSKITVGSTVSFKVEIIPGEDMENYVLKFAHPHDKQPVQEVKSPGGKKGITKQPSENNEDGEKNAGKPVQDTQLPKDVD